MVIATKFPSYLVRHSDKRVWLVHQFRQAYELDGTPLGQFGDTPEDRALRRKVHDLDQVALGEASHLFAISQNVAGRLAASTGLEAEVLSHPPQELDYRCQGYGDFVLSVNRLDRAKRIDLLIEAAAREPGFELVIAGEGPDRERLERLASEHGLNGRARFAGRVSERELADLYARCLAVYYAPVDEDYGMVPLEAFLSEKPVLTTTDAGGPLEVVSDHATGLVVAPDATEIAGALGWLRDHREEAAALGRAGNAIAREVTWDRAIGRLLS
jgi:glycosyltransferase involved in cell wall biosynthesis